MFCDVHCCFFNATSTHGIYTYGHPLSLHDALPISSGPGALHLLAGLYDAKMDHMPVVAIVGQQAVSALGSDFQQEVNLAAVFEDVSDYTDRKSTRLNSSH